ncbi:MAG: hypothetical protein PHT62_07585 [Desulfotomaculaceae bacterium]|nr:hypothetical protein [Desulfotomaculaceae bacterium]
MTAVQFLTKNAFSMDDRYDRVNLVIALELKLMEYLVNQNDKRVRDYIIAMRVLWPKMSELPVRLKLFKKALKFLESRGWQMHLVEDHSKRISGYITRTV